MNLADHPKWSLYRSLLFLGLTLLLAGCDGNQGAVAVDVGEAPTAHAYQVDIYAMEPGLDVVEGVYLTEGREVTLEDVPAGRWALLIQAQDGALNTLSHYRTYVEVVADETTEVVAGAYRPGMPGDDLPETSSGLARFGPDGEALLTALYAPEAFNGPDASVDLELLNGEGESVSEDEPRVLNRGAVTGTVLPGCGTGFVSAAALPEGERILGQESRPSPGEIPPGGTLDFFVSTTFTTVTCQRLLSDSQTEHCLIFAEVVNGSPVLSETTALEIAQGFDSDNPFQDGDSGIYRDTRARLGSEWVEGGGRDGDPRVVLVFLSSQAMGSEGLFGFFNPADQRSREESSTSNEGEILYLNADRAEGSLYDAFSSISHELSHLILYNQKVARDGAFPAGAEQENTVLDEGLAVLNEELSGFSYSGPTGGNFFLLGAVERLLEEGLNRSFFSFGGQYSDYGAGYLLWRYLHDRFGLETVKALTTSEQVGLTNLEETLDQPFRNVFSQFVQAVALNGRTDLPPELQFQDLDLSGTYPASDGTVYELRGLQGVREVSLPGSLTTTVEIKPWGAVIYLAGGGDGSPLSWKAAGANGLETKAVPLANAE